METYRTNWARGTKWPNWHKYYISRQLGPWNQLVQLASIGHIAPIGPMEPIGPIGINSLIHIAPIGPVEPICPIRINITYRANWARGTNWPNWHQYDISRQLGRWNQLAQLASIHCDKSHQLGPWNQMAQLAYIVHIAPIGFVEPIGPIGINRTYRAN